MTDGRGVEEEEKKEEEEVVRSTMRYGSQKIRDPDMRARHVSRRINEGAWPSSLLRLLVFSSQRERNLLRKCRYVDEGGSATIASSLSSRPLIARRVNIRLGDSRLDCVHCKSLSETTFRVKATFHYLKTIRPDIYPRYASLFY